MNNSIPRTSGIYMITCISTGKSYIGSAVNLRERQSQHFSEMRRGIHFNEHLQRAVNKYGIEDFVFKIIEECDREILFEREQYYLDWLQPFNERGFNIVPVVSAAMKGRKHKPETIEKIKMANKGYKPSLETIEKLKRWKRTPEMFAKISATKRATWQANHPGQLPKRKPGDPLKPRVMSAEHRQKISETWKGKQRNPTSVEKSAESRRKYYIVTDPQGIETIIKGLNKFCEQHGLNRSNMLAVASGKVKSHRGWKCQKIEE